MKKLMKSLSLNLFVLMLAASCNGLNLGLQEGDGDLDADNIVVKRFDNEEANYEEVEEIDKELYIKLLKKDGCKDHREFFDHPDLNEALIWTARKGYPNTMAQLLEDGADVDYRHGEYGYTPLMMVALNANDTVNIDCCTCLSFMTALLSNNRKKMGDIEDKQPAGRYVKAFDILMMHKADTSLVPDGGQYDDKSVMHILLQRNSLERVLICGDLANKLKMYLMA